MLAGGDAQTQGAGDELPQYLRGGPAFDQAVVHRGDVVLAGRHATEGVHAAERAKRLDIARILRDDLPPGDVGREKDDGRVTRHASLRVQDITADFDRAAVAQRDHERT